MSGGPWEDYAPRQAATPAPAAPAQDGPWADYAPKAPAASPARPGGEFTLSNIVKGIYNSAVSGATLPRDVYEGKVDPGSDEAIRRSLDLAGVASPLSPGKLATQAERSAIFGEAAAAPKAVAPAPAPAIAAAQDLGIPLTAGQKTADPALQSAENAMLGGAKGPSAQRVAQEAVANQQTQIRAARDTIGETAGNGMADLSRAADAGGAVADGVKASAAAARENFKGAYDRAFAGEGDFAPETLKGIGTRITDNLVQRAEPIIVDPVLTPAATRALGELDNIGNLKLGAIGQPGEGDEVVGISLRGVDQARRRLVAYYKAAKMNPTDARAVQGVIHEFDGQIEDAVANGLFSGSDETLGALREARQAFASYQRTFKPQGAGDDVGNALRNIVERDATPEQVANYLYGSTKIGATGTSVRMADRMKTLFGAESPEWAAIRQGAWQRLTNVAEGRTEMGPQKMSERILEFLNGDGQSLATRLFTDAERAQMAKFANVLKATVPKPGTTNASNSGNRAAALARETMSTIGSMIGASASGPAGAGVGYVLGKGIGAVGNARAAGQARQLYSGTAPVSIGQRLAQSGIRARNRVSPRAITQAGPGGLPALGPPGLNPLQGAVGARAEDEQR